MTFENNPFGEFEPEPWDSCYTLVWYIDPLFNKEKDRVWALTCTPLGVEVKGTKEMGYVTPEIEVEINPDIEHLNLNVDDYCPSYYLLNNECICYLEPEFTEDNDQYFWMFRFRPKYRIPTKEVSIGYIKPNFQIEYNPEVGELNYDLDYAITLCNFKYEHVWYLDPTITPNEEDVWAVKIYLPEIATEVKTAGYIKPTVEIESNEKFGNIEFSIDYKISWQDLKHEHIWLLEKRHFPNDEPDEWCVKVRHSNLVQSQLTIGYLSPRLFYEYNSALPKMDFNIEYDIPWYDFSYTQKFMLDTAYSPTGENIWAAKVFLMTETEGEKEVGIITPLIRDKLDVIFISYHEPNAEENWQRVLEKAPWAKRVNGVDGIYEAHRQAAMLSETDMFYVVDGDAWLVDDWDFDYQPNIFDRDCAYVWHSRNPINDLEYGYGGVKLFSKSAMLRSKGMTKLDMTTSVMTKLKVVEKVSNETRFDVDEFSTWRSAFRECVKLYYLSVQQPEEKDHQQRLDTWLTKKTGTYGSYALNGAKQAVNYCKENINSYNTLLNINNMSWLKEKFKEWYGTS
jgi:hypothetical protein